MTTLITISPGHWSNHGSGANGFINEVTEARKVVNRVVQILRENYVGVNLVEDNSSKNQQQNLNYLVSQHNKSSRSLDVSIHFNSSSTNNLPMGTEVLYYDQVKLADKMSANIARAGSFKNRGGKKRTELAFLANTNKPAVLLEICFVSSKEDARLYKLNFEYICQAIAKDLAEHVGKPIKTTKPNPSPSIPEKKVDDFVLTETGRKEARELIKRAVKEGVFNASHTDAKIDKYSDSELVSLSIAYVNRKLK